MKLKGSLKKKEHLARKAKIQLRIRLNFESKCNHCGVQSGEFWLWEEEIKDKYICGNCGHQEVVLLRQLERVEIDPWTKEDK